ncbi:TonB-dependent receptor [Pedobacter gandavensis]|uniref:TonB-dependent receptor n=1 Tax=Pedobacter gandavensis TaxID=2679963 RepID=UPI002930F296|nr:TonB-dependent receptor [Pedobacter gandavensis]
MTFPFRVLSFIWLLFIAGTTLVAAQDKTILGRPVSIHRPADSLIKVLHLIEEKTKCNFAFDPDLLRNKKTTALNFVQTPLSQVLSQVLFGTNLGFKLVGNDIVISPLKEKKWTISGHVRDQASGEELIGATVYLPELGLGINTNQYGFFSLLISEGIHQLLISNTGFQIREENIRLDQDLQINLELSLKTNRLEEVEIKSSNITPNPILLNEQNFGTSQLNNTAYYGGETDVVKKLQMQNGIKALSEGSSGMFVRGGNSDQNLILLDEAVVYNPAHLYGLVSVFNPDVVNNVQIYRDYIPANFGGRLSAVVINQMTEGNNKEYHLTGGLNFLSGRISAEGPIVKDKSSFIFAFRRSLLDVFRSKFKLFNPFSVYYDINAKANYKLNQNNTIFYSVYAGKDKLLSENAYTNNWGNLTSTFRWNHIFNSTIFQNVSLIYSNYNNVLDLNADTLSQKTQWQTRVRDITLKADYTYYLSPLNQIKFGGSGIYHLFNPGQVKQSPNDEFNIAGDESLEAAMYYSQRLSLSPNFELDYGLRLSLFKNNEVRNNLFDSQGNRVKTHEVKLFINPEPRLNFSYLPTADQRYFFTYNRNYQYLQLIQNSTLAFSSLEPWIPASKTIKPQHSDHFSLGYRYVPNQYMWSANAYYKYMDHQLELSDHAQIINNPEVRKQLKAGSARAYGLELELTKKEGKLSGTIAYSYSRVFRKIEALNFGKEFVANYDIPHELKISAKYELNKRLSFQSFFIYSTGRPLTLPVGFYQHDGLNVPIFEERNTTRFPMFSRMDISAQYQFRTRIPGERFLSSVLSVGIYNLYNRKNPLYYHLNSSSFEVKKSSIEYGLGFYPWIAYSFKI